MICPHCEFEIEDNLEICPYCQMFVTRTVLKEKKQEKTNVQSRLSKREFMRLEPIRKLRWRIHFFSVILYFYLINPIIVSEILHTEFSEKYTYLMLGLTIGMHIFKSRVCALFLTINLGIIGFAEMIETAGTRSRTPGILFFIVAGIAMDLVFKVHKAWKEYNQTGNISIKD